MTMKKAPSFWDNPKSNSVMQFGWFIRPMALASTSKRCLTRSWALSPLCSSLMATFRSTMS